MKFSVLALDYDGTIARDGVLDPEVRAAIAEVRAQGLTVLLVTGRTLSDLKKVAGDLGFIDAVVAENGAVLYFPNGHTRFSVIRHPRSSLQSCAVAESLIRPASASWNRTPHQLRRS